jgi:hypothetical protein
VCSPKGRALKGVSPRVFPNLRRTHEYRNSLYINNSLFISSLLSHFIETKYFHGNMGTYKIEGAPPA